MEFQSILLIAGVLLLVAAFVGWPFLQTAARRAVDDRTRSSLLAERERLLTILRELDFDYSLGKIPEEDYPAQRADLVRQGAEVMKKLDVIPSPIDPAIPPDADEPAQVSDDDIEDLIAKRRSGSNGKAGGFCPNCGKATLASDRFCPNCGKAM
jgi:hypothetical protein